MNRKIGVLFGCLVDFIGIVTRLFVYMGDEGAPSRQILDLKVQRTFLSDDYKRPLIILLSFWVVTSPLPWHEDPNLVLYGEMLDTYIHIIFIFTTFRCDSEVMAYEFVSIGQRVPQILHVLRDFGVRSGHRWSVDNVHRHTILPSEDEIVGRIPDAIVYRSARSSGDYWQNIMPVAVIIGDNLPYHRVYRSVVTFYRAVRSRPAAAGGMYFSIPSILHIS